MKTTKYKIKAEPDSFTPTKLFWRVYVKSKYMFLLHSWEWIATYSSKEDAIKCVETLIDAGEEFELP
jgi:hypothetical protein